MRAAPAVRPEGAAGGAGCCALKNCVMLHNEASKYANSHFFSGWTHLSKHLLNVSLRCTCGLIQADNCAWMFPPANRSSAKMMAP